MPQKFRPEIQGLRAVAALLVAVYHIWFARVSGGVDVFFVVSGFLITHSLLNRSAGDGGIRPAAFLWDLYARLGPPALLVVAVTAIGSRLFLPHADWPFNIGEAVSSALFVNNWHLAFNAVDYLNRTGDPRPFQHFWALSVQWQFYLLWAVLFVLVHRMARTRFRAALSVSIATLFVTSLIVSIVYTARDQPFAYFNTATRIWEFAAGGLLALYQAPRRLAPVAGVALGWVGLAVIVACGALLPVSSTFPGFVALVPVIAALLIIANGPSEHWASVRRLLGWAPLVAFGRISYYFYLWHWPLVVLWLSYSLQSRAGFGVGLGIIAAALLLSMGTHFLMQFSWSRTWRPLSGQTATALTIISLAICLAWRTEASNAKSAQLAMPIPSASTHPGALAIGREVKPYPLFPGTFRVREDYPSAYKTGCSQTTTGTEVITCTYGDAHGHITIAAIGNSHITHWLPALDLAGRERGWRIVLVTKDDCQLHVHSAGNSGEAVQSCDAWNERLLQVVRGLSPDFLFMSATRHLNDLEMFPADYRQAWQQLIDDNSRIIAIRATPRFPFDVPDCLDLHGAGSPRCRASRTIALGASSPDLRESIERTGVKFLDLTRFFCDELECFPAVGNIVIYRDHDHLTPTYVETMKDFFADELQSLMHRGTSVPGAMQVASTCGQRLASAHGGDPNQAAGCGNPRKQ